MAKKRYWTYEAKKKKVLKQDKWVATLRRQDHLTLEETSEMVSIRGTILPSEVSGVLRAYFEQIRCRRQCERKRIGNFLSQNDYQNGRLGGRCHYQQLCEKHHHRLPPKQRIKRSYKQIGLPCFCTGQQCITKGG